MWSNVKSELLGLAVRFVLMIISVTIFIVGQLWFEGKL